MLAPLPDWAWLRPRKMNPGLLAARLARLWGQNGARIYPLARGASAFAVLARLTPDSGSKAAARIWVPDYFCGQSLKCARAVGAKIVFYPIDERLNPDWSELEDLLADGPPDIFVLVHYFGFKIETERAEKFCKKHSCLLLEDRAHCLAPFKNAEGARKGVASLYTPHKLLAVPSGALLVSGDSFDIPEMNFRVGASTLKWLFKRSIQNLVGDCLSRTLAPFPPPDFDSDFGGTLDPGTGFDPVGAAILMNMPEDLSVFSVRRFENEAVADSCLLRLDGVEKWPRARTREETPYLAVYRCSSTERARRLFAAFNRDGLLAQTWPDLAPEVRENPERHRRALELRSRILTFPVHQSLTPGRLNMILEAGVKRLVK